MTFSHIPKVSHFKKVWKSPHCVKDFKMSHAGSMKNDTVGYGSVGCSESNLLNVPPYSLSLKHNVKM